MNSRLFLVLRSAARVPRTSAGRTVVRHLRPCFVLAREKGSFIRNAKHAKGT